MSYNESIAIENFINFCDNMIIAEEGSINSKEKSYASIESQLFDSTTFKNTKEYYNEKGKLSTEGRKAVNKILKTTHAVMSKEADKKLSDKMYRRWYNSACKFLSEIGNGYIYELNYSSGYSSGKSVTRISIDAGYKEN